MQTEKKGLSKRERFLLIAALAVGLLAAAVQFAILPLNSDLQDKNEQYSNMEFEKSKLDAQFASETAIRDNNSAAIGEYNSKSGMFLSESLSNEIGRLLTNLCENHGLSPSDLKLSAPKPFSMDEKGAETDAENANKSVFLTVTATMTVKGGYDDLKTLLDDVEQTAYIRVSRTSVTWKKETGGETVYIDPEPDRITLEFEVTMLKGNWVETDTE